MVSGVVLGVFWDGVCLGGCFMGMESLEDLMDFEDIEGMEFPEEPWGETEDLHCMLFCFLWYHRLDGSLIVQPSYLAKVWVRTRQGRLQNLRQMRPGCSGVGMWL